MNLIRRTLCSIILPLVAAPVLAEPSAYEIDPTHTFATFETSHFDTSTIRGRFSSIQGRIHFDPETRDGKAVIELKVDSLSTGIDSFDRLLLGSAVLDAERHPTARFESAQFISTSGRLERIDGTLNLLGVSKPASIQAARFNCYKSMFGKNICGGDFILEFDRSAHGLDFGLNWGFSKNIRVVIQIEAAKLLGVKAAD